MGGTMPDSERRWTYTLVLHCLGEVTADNEDDARLAATEDARESLDWNPEWFALGDLTLEPLEPASAGSPARASEGR